MAQTGPSGAYRAGFCVSKISSVFSSVLLSQIVFSVFLSAAMMVMLRLPSVVRMISIVKSKVGIQAHTEDVLVEHIVHLTQSQVAEVLTTIASE